MACLGSNGLDGLQADCRGSDNLVASDKDDLVARHVESPDTNERPAKLTCGWLTNRLLFALLIDRNQLIGIAQVLIAEDDHVREPFNRSL